MKTPRRKTPATLALRIARAQLRAIRDYAAPAVASQAKPGPPQFIMCWAVGRGYSGVTQALDSAGQVWERRTLMEEVLVDGKKVKEAKDSWWFPIPMDHKTWEGKTLSLSMQRRALEEKA